jgi:hypothetical protein
MGTSDTLFCNIVFLQHLIKSPYQYVCKMIAGLIKIK